MLGPLMLLIGPLCSDPVPQVAASVVPSSHALTPAPAAGDVDSILDNWSRASKGRGALSKSNRENLRLNVSRSLNGHAAIAAEKLTGIVDVSQLKDQFTWQLVEVGEANCLDAVPKDETERLFFSSIRVWLHPTSWRVEKLQLADRQCQACVTWNGIPASDVDMQPTCLSAASLARTPILQHHCSTLPDRIDSGWTLLARSRISAEGIPPSPAVLNVAGWDAARRIVGERFHASLRATFLDPFGEPLAAFDGSQDPTDILPVTPEVAQILDRWEGASRSMKPCRIAFSRTICDLSEEVEIRAEGLMAYKSPSEGRIQIRPSDIGQPAGRASWRLKADDPVEWDFSTDEILCINRAAKTYSVVPLPPQQKGNQGFLLQSLQFHAPLVFEIQMDKLRRQWSFNLVKQDSQNVFLEALPRTAELRSRYQSCLVLINSSSSKTTAVKYFSASGKKELVYKVNSFDYPPGYMIDLPKPELRKHNYRKLDP